MIRSPRCSPATARTSRTTIPSRFGIGYGLLDYDVLAQLYNQNVWRNTLGLSDLGNPGPFSQSDAVKAWHDVGRSGEPDGTENLALAFYTYMGIMLQQAGPTLTPTTMHNGLMALKALWAGTQHTRACVHAGLIRTAR